MHLPIIRIQRTKQNVHFQLEISNNSKKFFKQPHRSVEENNENERNLMLQKVIKSPCETVALRPMQFSLSYATTVSKNRRRCALSPSLPGDAVLKAISAIT